MRNVRKAVLSGVLGLGLVGVGCESPTADTYANSAGSLALSRDDALLYAVDTDNELLAVVDTQTDSVLERVKVGKSPERVVVGPDDTLYVSNRGERSVSVIRRGDWGTVQKIEVGVEPIGLAVAPDNKTLYVVNSTSLTAADRGSLMAIDLASWQPRWEVEVGEEPRGIALLPDNTALVSLYRQGDVVKVDLTQGRVLKARTELYSRVNESRLTAAEVPSARPGSFSSFRPRAVNDVVATPDGKRVFAPVVWAREDAITTRPSAFGGYYANGGPCNIGSVATAGVLTFKADGEPLVDDLTSCSFSTNSDAKDFPPSTLTPPVRGQGNATQGPVAMVVDPTGAWLFVVNKETNNVVVMPTERRTGDGISFESSGSSVRGGPVTVGRGPDGIALTRDGLKAYVYSQFDHRIDTLISSGNGPNAKLINTNKPIPVASDVLGANIVAGRRLFFDALDNRMSASGTNVACSTCHLEGRDDGHVWNFPDGPRQTPTLAGRAMGKTGPYHWSGEFNTLFEFMDHTVKLRMGGSGVTETMSAFLQEYVDSIPAPDNPHRLPDGTLTEAQQRGQQVFHKAGCDACHSGATFTNNTFADVGTMVRSGPNPDDLSKLGKMGGLNTPSLLSLARTAPYLHDGSASTIKARILSGKLNDQHGTTSTLSDAEVDDLVEYLQSL